MRRAVPVGFSCFVHLSLNVRLWRLFHSLSPSCSFPLFHPLTRSLFVHSPLPTCSLPSPHLFILLSLCPLSSRCLFILFQPSIYSNIPTCLPSSPYVFTLLSLRVHSPLPTCLLSSPYLFIPASLPVYSPLRTCALSSHYLFTLPYFPVHSRPHSCISPLPTVHSPLYTGSLSSPYLFILLSVPVHSNLKGHVMPGFWGSLLLHTHQKIKSCPVITKTASYKYGRSVHSRREKIDLKYAAIFF